MCLQARRLALLALVLSIRPATLAALRVPLVGLISLHLVQITWRVMRVPLRRCRLRINSSSAPVGVPGRLVRAVVASARALALIMPLLLMPFLLIVALVFLH